MELLYVWAGSLNCCLNIFDKVQEEVQEEVHRIAGPTLSVSVEPVLRYSYYFGK